MKVSTSWINSWLSRTISDTEVINALERAGLEVEQFTYSKPLDDKIVVALVKKVIQHPGADRLKIATITTGSDEIQIVCGASNVRAGLVVALAQVKAILPDGSQIKASKLRGEISHGMLCSAEELGLGDDHDRIMELDTNLVLNTKLSDLYPADGILDVKTHANRSDLQSVIGLAREVSAMTGAGLRALPSPHASKGKGPAVEPNVRASRYSLTEITVDTSAPTPDWMAARIRSAGMRPISLVVDITNYVMLETGQPLHAFDADLVKLPVNVRPAVVGEWIKTLDGTTRKLTESDLVITDQTGLIALAGVMGGESTEVSSKTKRIYLESAIFDAVSIRKTAKRQNLRSEASARIERGLPVQLIPIGLARAIELFEAHAAAKVVGTTDQLNVWPWVQRIGLREERLNRLLGFELGLDEAVKALAKLEIKAERFDIVEESKKHLGKPYKWGGNFKQDGISEFDCSYYIDYIYSLIGVMVGHTASQIMDSAKTIELKDLRPGDTLYRDGKWVNADRAERNGVSHVAMFIGDGQIIHAENYHRVDGEWVEMPVGDQMVCIDPLAIITEDSHFIGARRHIENLSDWLSVPQVPWWRTDLKLSEDLVEEVVRVVGYDRVPSTIPTWRPQSLSFDRDIQLQSRLQAILSGTGLFEVMTYSFVGEDQLQAVGLAATSHLKLKNPLSSEQAYLRSSLLPSHLSVLGRNRNYAKSFGYYELSKVFLRGAKGEQPLEPKLLGITVTRPERAYSWIKGLLDTVATAYGVSFELKRSDTVVGYAKGRFAAILLQGKTVGMIGQIDPVSLRELKVGSEAAHLELNLESVFGAATVIGYASKQRFPSVGRDVTVIVDEATDWQTVAKALASVEHTTVSYKGDYYGADLAKSQKSLTLHLELSYPDRTPTEAEAAAVQARVVSILHRLFKAALRS